MKLKRIEAIFTPPASHMVGDGFKVHQFIPSVKGLDMKRMRSEERRVGKECRSRWSPYH